ncbi:hypothetical protein B0H67DRAFT_647277 [Lasiosphaeris hirsuta]|uniref:Uncharacterized protein n=1 Tax=Lasiosphaeris hirsuta TaxID=260670 RepID=A0AA40A9W6_9PEZI|nr:hypothetical protein B0H67DRAFT_647277 [Lasiosphaeris hirsuta]
MTAYYLFAFNPNQAPLYARRHGATEDAPNKVRDPIPVALLATATESMLTMTLVSAYDALSTGITTYYWKVAVYVACNAHTTYQAGFVFLRKYPNELGHRS